MQPRNEPLKEWYQGESLEAYLDALFRYYDHDGVIHVEKAIEEQKGIAIPSCVNPFKRTHRSLFETILAKYGLSLSDASFEEIMEGDYYSVLSRYGLTDDQPCNHTCFKSEDGVI